MANSDFDVELFERRLHTLKDSQESIQGLSSWCLERRQHHKKIVATWLQVLKKGKLSRMSFFNFLLLHRSILVESVSRLSDGGFYIT